MERARARQARTVHGMRQAGVCALRQSSHTRSFLVLASPHRAWHQAGWAAPSQPAPCMALAVALPASLHCAWHSEEKETESRQRTAGGQMDRQTDRCRRPTLYKVRALGAKIQLKVDNRTVNTGGSNCFDFFVVHFFVT